MAQVDQFLLDMAKERENLASACFERQDTAEEFVFQDCTEWNDVCTRCTSPWSADNFQMCAFCKKLRSLGKISADGREISIEAGEHTGEKLLVRAFPNTSTNRKALMLAYIFQRAVGNENTSGSIISADICSWDMLILSNQVDIKGWSKINSLTDVTGVFQSILQLWKHTRQLAWTSTAAIHSDTITLQKTSDGNYIAGFDHMWESNIVEPQTELQWQSTVQTYNAYIGSESHPEYTLVVLLLTACLMRRLRQYLLESGILEQLFPRHVNLVIQRLSSYTRWRKPQWTHYIVSLILNNVDISTDFF